MATATSSSALDRLAELDGAVDVALGREREIESHRAKARREAAAAAWELDAYHEAVGAGELEDGEAEAKLAAARDHATRAAEDSAWTARLRGAEAARSQAEAARSEYLRSAFERLAAEEAALDAPVRDRLAEAYAAREEAEAAYVGRVRAWHRYVRGGLLDPGDVPGDPLRGEENEVRARAARGFELPTPRSLRGAAA